MGGTGVRDPRCGHMGCSGTQGRCSATCSGRTMSGADMRRCSAAPQTRGCGLGSDSGAGSGAGCSARVPAATGARRGGMAGALRACRSGRRRRRLRCHPRVLRFRVGGRQCRAADRLGRGEGLLRHDRRKTAVGEIEIGARRIAARACAEIARIGNDAGIDRGDVTGVVCVPRPIGLAGAEREPAGQRADGGGGDDRRRVADPSDEPGRIDRVGGIVARGPAPQPIDIGPAAVMERRKPPGLDIDPVPAPRLDPAPIAVAIRDPADRHRAREPHRAVMSDRAPAAVFVERLVPGHLRRDVIGRCEAALVVIVGAAPCREIILARLLDRGGQRLRATDDRSIAGLHRDIEAAADKSRAALEHGDPLGLVAAAGIDVINSGLQDPDRAPWQVNFDALAFEQGAHTHIDAALLQRELHDLLVELGDRELGVAVHRDRPAADPKLGAGFRIGPEGFASCGRVVERGLRPSRLARPVKAELARDNRHPPDPRRRLLLREGRRRGEQAEDQQ